MITLIFINGQGKKENFNLPEVSDEIFELGARFETAEQRDSFAAQFPAKMKVRSYTSNSYEGRQMVAVPHYMCSVSAMRNAKKVTGEKNETGDKRVTRFRQALISELT